MTPLVTLKLAYNTIKPFNLSTKSTFFYHTFVGYKADAKMNQKLISISPD
jgi:hypothetical protein